MVRTGLLAETPAGHHVKERTGPHGAGAKAWVTLVRTMDLCGSSRLAPGNIGGSHWGE